MSNNIDYVIYKILCCGRIKKKEHIERKRLEKLRKLSELEKNQANEDVNNSKVSFAGEVPSEQANLLNPQPIIIHEPVSKKEPKNSGLVDQESSFTWNLEPHQKYKYKDSDLLSPRTTLTECPTMPITPLISTSTGSGTSPKIMNYRVGLSKSITENKF